MYPETESARLVRRCDRREEEVHHILRRHPQRGYLTPATRWHLPHRTTSRVETTRQFFTWPPMFVVEKYTCRVRKLQSTHDSIFVL